MNEPIPNQIPFPADPFAGTKLKEPATPTIEMCVALAVTLGMPPEEGERFFHHHEQKDWLIGKNRIKRWRSALALWNLNWQKWNQPKAAVKVDATKPLPMELFVWSRELEEVQRQMQQIRGSYSENMDWDDKDKGRFRELKARKSELLRLLGRVV